MALPSAPGGRASGAETTPPAKRAGCPADYLVHGADTFSSQEIDDARHGNFEVAERPVHIERPVNWAYDPNHSRRFRGALNTLVWLDVLFYAYQQGDQGALRQARGLVLDWIGANPPDHGATDRTWDDRVTATRAVYIAYALRAGRCERALDAHQAKQLRQSVGFHGRHMESAKHYKPTNHGLFVDTNLILLARSVPGIAKGKGWERTGKQRFRRTLDGRTIATEGFWLEHSAAYQLAIRHELDFYMELVGAGADDLAALFERMTDVAGWLVEPDGEIVLLGSSNYKELEPEVEAAAADDDGMLWLRRSGLAIVKKPGAFLSMAATFFNGSHKHSDDLSFDLYDQGRRIVTDSGLYDKDPGRWSRFGASAEAHTTLTVDGERFSQNPKNAYRSGLLAGGEGDGWFGILGHNPLIRSQGVDHQRLLLYRPGLGALVVDRVRSDHTHTYRRYFQIGSDLDAAKQPGDVVGLSDGSWSGTLADESEGSDVAIKLARGQRHPEILGFEFPDFRQRVPRYTAVMRTEGKDLDHLATLGVDPDHPLSASLTRSPGAAAEIELEVSGSPAGTLEVVREGHQLEIALDPGV